MSEIGESAPAAAGFTLIEMLVILAIVSLISGILFPSVERALRGQDFATASMQVELALRAARAAAVRNGTPVRFQATEDRRAVRYADAVERMPDSARVAVSDDGIAFFPDGSATGGSVTLSGRSRAEQWTVRPTTGAIERRR